MNEDQKAAYEKYIRYVFDAHKEVFEKVVEHVALFGSITDEKIEEIVLEHISEKDSTEN